MLIAITRSRGHDEFIRVRSEWNISQTHSSPNDKDGRDEMDAWDDKPRELVLKPAEAMEGQFLNAEDVARA